MPSFESRLRGGIYGLLAGDALGVPYEFKSAREVPPREHIEFVPPPDYPRTYPSIAPGTWSDDGAQALALLDSLLNCGRLDLNDLAENIASWSQFGKFAVDNNVFDIGITTERAVEDFRSGVDAAEAGPRDEYSNGNGSLMRVLPLVLWHQGSDMQLAEDAMSQSLVTHGHERAQLCCAFYCVWARRLLDGMPSTAAWDEATKVLYDVFETRVDGFVFQNELESQLRPHDFSPGQGSGYVVDSLRSARWVMQEEGFEHVAKAAVALGKDTDTTACIAAGVAGVREGFEAIPARWIEGLRGKEMVEPLLTKLLAWHSQPL